MQPATMAKVSAALSDLRGDQGMQQQEALLSSLRVQALHAAAWMTRPSLAALHVGPVDLAPAARLGAFTGAEACAYQYSEPVLHHAGLQCRNQCHSKLYEDLQGSQVTWAQNVFPYSVVQTGMIMHVAAYRAGLM